MLRDLDDVQASEDFVDPRKLVNERGTLAYESEGTSTGISYTARLYEVGHNEERQYVAEMIGERDTVDGGRLETETLVHDAGQDVNVMARYVNYDEHGWETYESVTGGNFSWPEFAREGDDDRLDTEFGYITHALALGRESKEQLQTVKDEARKPQYIDEDNLTAVDGPIQVLGHDGWEEYDPDRFQLHKNTPLLTPYLDDEDLTQAGEQNVYAD